MPNNLTTDAGLSPTMMTYYVKEFLSRPKELLIFEQGLQKRTHPKNNGKTVNFTRYTVPSQITSALSEGVNPTSRSLNATTVAATLAEYGDSFALSRFLSLTDIDQENKEKISIAGQVMAESRDVRVRNELATGATVVRPSTATSDITTTSAMILTSTEVRKVTTKLRKNKALPIAGKFPWLAKIGLDAGYDLKGDTLWNQAKTYSDTKDLYNGEIGELHGARFLETTQPTIFTGVGASSIDLTYSYFHGAEAAGVMDLEGDQMQVYIVPHTKVDSGNVAGRLGFISWAGTEAYKTLNANWILGLKHAFTAV